MKIFELKNCLNTICLCSITVFSHLFSFFVKQRYDSDSFYLRKVLIADCLLQSGELKIKQLLEIFTLMGLTFEQCVLVSFIGVF